MTVCDCLRQPIQLSNLRKLVSACENSMFLVLSTWLSEGYSIADWTYSNLLWLPYPWSAGCFARLCLKA